MVKKNPANLVSDLELYYFQYLQLNQNNYTDGASSKHCKGLFTFKCTVTCSFMDVKHLSSSHPPLSAARFQQSAFILLLITPFVLTVLLRYLQAFSSSFSHQQ